MSPADPASALFDEAYYRRAAGLAGGTDAFAHYLQQGEARGLRPNAVFEPAWYLARNPAAARPGPLRHYAEIGEAQDRDPSPLFDVKWYRRTYAVERPLEHYLAHRFGPVSPVPEFDAAFYLNAYPDVGEAGLDPFQHYLHMGFREFRLPFEGFEPRLYALRRMAGARGENPVVHLRAHPHPSPVETRRASGPQAAVRLFTHAGPAFEPPEPSRASETPRATLLAFHLPQFHAIPENDAWWGAGYTEWTALARGQPRFAGHYQPRIPGQLGFYDLRDPETLKAQASLARGAGVAAFVFYHYDFGGKRLLQAPVDCFLAHAEIDIGFCLMWANENWTRSWDGAAQEVLLAQDYSRQHEGARLADFARAFRDLRYLRLEGRPVLMVYRASLIPDTAATILRWRGLFKERHGENPIFVMAQTFDDIDPRPLGFDAAIEFPPHKLTRGLPQAFDALDVFDEGLEADLFAYDDVAAASLAEPAPDFPVIKTAAPSWDNDARRQGKGLTLVGATPAKFERWLGALIDRATPMFGARLVAVNAWNEWSEGAYLEPDVHYGAAALNAVQRAVFGGKSGKLAFCALGADATARRLAAAFGLRAEVFTRAEDAIASGLPAAVVGDPGDAALLAKAGLRVAWQADAMGFRRQGGAAQVERVVFADEAEREQAGAIDAHEIASEAGARALFTSLFPGTAKISAVLHIPPGGAASPTRLAALFAQTHPLWEIVVIDETGSETALGVIEAAAEAADRDLTIYLDPPAPQGRIPWARVIEAASGDFLWLTTADGGAEPTLLTRLATPFRDDPRLVLAYCDSAPIDELSRRIALRPSPLAPRTDPLVDGVYEGAQFEGRGPANPGAAVWRLDALRAVAAPAGVLLPALVRQLANLPQARIFHLADALDLISPAGAVDRNQSR